MIPYETIEVKNQAKKLFKWFDFAFANISAEILSKTYDFPLLSVGS